MPLTFLRIRGFLLISKHFIKSSTFTLFKKISKIMFAILSERCNLV